MKTCPKCFQENLDDSRFCKHCGTSLSTIEGDKAGDPLVGKILAGNFAVKRKVAVGGMGSIYEAEQVSLQKRVCIKVLHKHLLRDNTIIKRFHREARAASKLKHANCINVIDFGQADNGVLYLAMDFVEGRDLADTLAKDHPLSAERVLHIMKQVASALDEAHANGIIHRDLKPENIMVEQRRQSADHVIVLDFGIAKIKEPGRDDRETFQTMAGVVCGTPEYMSPEQIRGEELDARTDIYSFGVIMWQLFTNRLPFNGATPIATVTKHLTERPEPPSKYAPDIPAPIEAYILRMMSKVRTERPATALEIKERLEELEDALKNRGGPTTIRPSVYDSDLDATMIVVGPSRMSDQSRQAIAGMSLPDDGRAPARASEQAAAQGGGPAKASAAAPRPNPTRKAPQPGARTNAPSPGAAQQRPIRDPLQRAMSSLDQTVDDLPDDDLRPRRSGRKGLWIGLAVLVVVALAAAAYALRPAKAPEPTATEVASASAPAAEGASANDRDVVEAPETRADASAPDAAKAPDAARATDTAALTAPDAAPAVASVVLTAKADEPPMRVVRLAPEPDAPKVVSKKAAGGTEGKAKDYEKMGDKAFSGGNYAEAKAYFNLALKYANSAALHKKIGYCYKNLGRLDDARQSFRQYLQGLPADKRATEEAILKGQGLL